MNLNLKKNLLEAGALAIALMVIVLYVAVPFMAVYAIVHFVLKFW